MKKTIIVISNPFCFGPTGKAAEIIEALRRRVKHDRLVYVGSGLCNEIINSDGVTIKVLDERDENALAEFFKTVERPHIVSSQNRFAVRAAKCVGAPSAFLDGLAWFWREIPPEHLIADEIFWVNFPGMSEKSSAVGRPIHLIPAMVPKPNIQHSLRTALLIHLGGVWNPLTKGLPLSYLDMLSLFLNSTPK